MFFTETLKRLSTDIILIKSDISWILGLLNSINISISTPKHKTPENEESILQERLIRSKLPVDSEEKMIEFEQFLAVQKNELEFVNHLLYKIFNIYEKNFQYDIHFF